MSDFDNIKIGDWVRIWHSFAKNGPTQAYTVTYEGIVTDRDAGLLLISEGGDDEAVSAWVHTFGTDSDWTVRLAAWRPSREVGWHEVFVDVGPNVAGERVLWWDGQEWRWGPHARTDAVNVINNDSTYLGRGSL